MRVLKDLFIFLAAAIIAVSAFANPDISAPQPALPLDETNKLPLEAMMPTVGTLAMNDNKISQMTTDVPAPVKKPKKKAPTKSAKKIIAPAPKVKAAVAQKTQAKTALALYTERAALKAKLAAASADTHAVLPQPQKPTVTPPATVAATKLSKPAAVVAPAAPAQVQTQAQAVSTSDVAELVIPEGAQFLVGDEKDEFFVIGKDEVVPKIETPEEKAKLASIASDDAQKGLNQASELINKVKATKLEKALGEKVHSANTKREASNIISTAMQQPATALVAENKVTKPALQIAEYPVPTTNDATTSAAPSAQPPAENAPAPAVPETQPSPQPETNAPAPSAPAQPATPQPETNEPARSTP